VESQSRIAEEQQETDQTPACSLVVRPERQAQVHKVRTPMAIAFPMNNLRAVRPCM
jgi:hypothetical protein